MKARFLLIWLLVLFFANSGSAQKVVVLTSSSELYRLDQVSGRCVTEKLELPCSGINGPISAIALRNDTLYFISKGNLYRSIVAKPSLCTKLASGVNSNALTVDRNGKLYWISGAMLVKFDPHSLMQTDLGMMPYASGGDLVFYKGKLYLAAGDGIVAVDMQDPAKSTMVISAPGRSFFGLINMPVGCDSTALYGIEPLGNFSNLVDIDIGNKKLGNTYCSFGLDVSDAASYTEADLPAGIRFDSVGYRPICPSATTAFFEIWVYTAADIGYTAYISDAKGVPDLHPNHVSENRIGLTLTRSKPRPFYIRLVSDEGCEIDTTIYPVYADDILADVVVSPDTCGAGKGAVFVNTTGGRSPFVFTLDSMITQRTPGFASLVSGDHKVKVTDSNFCVRWFDFTIKPISPPLPLSSLSVIPATGCGTTNGGEIRFSFLSAANITGVSLDDGVFQKLDRFTGVSIGSHRFRINTPTCLFDTTIVMGLANGAGPRISFSNEQPDCRNGNGSTVISVSGVATPFTINFNGTGFGTTKQFSNLSPGVYPVVIKDADGCEWPASDTIFAYAPVKPQAQLALNDTCTGKGTARMFLSGPGSPYYFELSGRLYGSGILVPNLSPGVYAAHIYNSARCPVDTVDLTIGPGMDCDTIRGIYVPSAFTPNGDGRNDVLRPLGNPTGKLMRYVFRVYNRFGQVVFESRVLNKGWDGNYNNTQQPPGTYVWIFEGTDANGQTAVFKGTTVLIR